MTTSVNILIGVFTSAALFVIFAVIHMCVNYHKQRIKEFFSKVPRNEADVESEGELRTSREEKTMEERKTAPKEESIQFPQVHYYSEYKSSLTKVETQRNTRLMRKLPAVPPRNDENEYYQYPLDEMETYQNLVPPPRPPKKNAPPLPPKKKKLPGFSLRENEIDVLRRMKREIPVLPPKTKEYINVEDSHDVEGVTNGEYGELSDFTSGNPTSLFQSRYTEMTSRAMIVEKKVQARRVSMYRRGREYVNVKEHLQETHDDDEDGAVTNEEYGILSQYSSGNQRSTEHKRNIETLSEVINRAKTESVEVNDDHENSFEEDMQVFNSTEIQLENLNRLHFGSDTSLNMHDMNIDISEEASFQSENSMDINLDSTEEFSERQNYMKMNIDKVEQFSVRTEKTTSILLQESVIEQESGNNLDVQNYTEEEENQKMSLQSNTSVRTCRFCSKQMKSLGGFKLHNFDLHYKCFCNPGPSMEETDDPTISDEEISEGQNHEKEKQVIEIETQTLRKIFACAYCNKKAGKTENISEFLKHLFTTHKKCYCELDLRKFTVEQRLTK